MKRTLYQLIFICLLIICSIEGAVGVCYTEVCNETVAELLRHLDLEVDPCQDFYRFTCGTFLRDSHLTENDLTLSSYQYLGSVLDEQLKALMEEPVSADALLFESVTKQFYSSCINIDSIEEKDTEPILDIFDHFGGWPILNNDWDENGNDLTTILTKLNVLGFGDLLTMQIFYQDTDSSVMLPVLFQPKVSFQHEDYAQDLEAPKVNLLRHYMNKTLNLLKGDLNAEKLEQDIDDMLTFEINLSKILLTPQEEKVRQSTQTNVANLTQIFEGIIRFDDFVRDTFEEANITILDTQPIQIFYPPYIAKLPELLRTSNHRTIINYLLWHVFYGFTTALPARFREAKDFYVKSVFGYGGEKNRWKDCLSTINGYLQEAVGALYIQKHFTTSAKEKMLSLIGELKSAFLEMLDENVWMSEETKEKAKLKASSIKEKIGYPDEFIKSDFYEDVLSGIEVDDSSFLKNWYNVRKKAVVDALKNLVKTNLDENFLGAVATINAYYIPNSNAIEFPAGILQHPFFKEDRPMYQNFGAIGYVIGHEITHGFDGTGRLYNKEGNNQNWWKDEDITKFVNMSQCFVDQYDGFVVREVNESVNGRLTLDENIADAGGIRESFRAYKKWASKMPNDEVELPGLPYSTEQMLFIYFGRLNCVKARREIEILLIKTDGHSPAEFRVNGPLMNLEEFSETFNCPVGSPMNPVNKCQIW